MYSWLLKDFGNYGEGLKTEEFTKGTYQVPEEVDIYTKEFIKACKFTEKDKETDLRRSPVDFRNSWKRMDERTTSRRLHFGHFKAATNNQLNLTTHYYMAEIPFRSGY